MRTRILFGLCLGLCLSSGTPSLVSLTAAASPENAGPGPLAVQPVQTVQPMQLPESEITARGPQKTVRYALYKFMQKIGYERDTYLPTSDGGREVKAVFSFQDRGTSVP